MTVTPLNNPFPGLRPFNTDERYVFFGREGQSEAILDRLRENRLVALVGASGSGKSSLIRAGVLPYLYGGFLADAGSRWRVAMCRPGNDPIGNLAAALCEPQALGSASAGGAKPDELAMMQITLRGSSAGLIDAVRIARLSQREQIAIIIDQFEELFRFASLSSGPAQDEDAASFVKLVLEAQRQREFPIYVVLGLRSDYIGDCSRFRDLPERVAAGLHLVPRMTRDQRRATIVEPIRVGGGMIAPRLVNRLLNDVGDDPDQLPILQHALMRTWEHWRHNTTQAAADNDESAPTPRPIDIEDYLAIGGMTRALSIHADEAYAALPDDCARAVARVAFQCLTGKDVTGHEARHPTSVATIADVAKVDHATAIDVINHFRHPARAFLMPPAPTEIGAGAIIDISHESLIRGWDLLRKWAEDESESAKIYQRIAEAAALHVQGKEGLWHDPALQLALDWREKREPNEAWARRYSPEFAAAMRFLDESRNARDARRSAQERRRKGVLASVVSTACVMALLGAFGWWQWNQSQAELTNKLAAQRLYLASLADQWTSAGNSAAALALMLELLPDQPSVSRQSYFPQAEFQLQKALHSLHEKLVITPDQANGARVLAATFSSDGKLIVTASSDGRARLWNAQTGGRMSVQFPPGRSEWDDGLAINDASFSPNGQLVVTASDDKLARIWDAATGVKVADLEGHRGEVLAAAFSPDGGSIVTTSTDGTACVWDVQARKPSCTPDAGARELRNASFSADGKRFVTGSADGEVAIWDTAQVTRVTTSAPMRHENVVTGVVYSRDRKYIVSSSLDRTAIVWDAETGKPIRTIAVGDPVESVAISSDGRLVATASDSNTAQIWDVASGTPHGPRLTSSVKLQPDAIMRRVAFSFDGRRILTASDDGTARVWNVEVEDSSPLPLNRSPHRGAVRSASFNSDGTRIVTASEDATARVWDATTGDLVHEFSASRAEVLGASFSPDGKYIVTASKDGLVVIWDVVKGNQAGAPVQVPGGGPVNKAVFSPDGRRIVTASEQGPAWIWDVGTRKSVGPPLGADAVGTRTGAFSPDGQQIVTAHRDGTVRIWDADTGKQLASHRASIPALRSAAYNSKGDLIVTADADGKVQIWDARTLQPRLPTPISGGEGKAITYSAVFSPDGLRVLTASADRTARLFDVATGTPIDVPFVHAGAVWTAAFDSKGKRIVTASADRIARIWPIFENFDALVQHAREVAPRCLTPMERAEIQILPSDPSGSCKKK